MLHSRDTNRTPVRLDPRQAPPAMLPSAPPARCSAAAADGSPRQHQHLRAQRRQHGQLERPAQLARFFLASCSAGAAPNRNQSAPRQLQHGGQDGRAGQHAAHHVTQIAAHSQQHRRFSPAQHEISHVRCVSHLLNVRSLAYHCASGRTCFRSPPSLRRDSGRRPLV